MNRKRMARIFETILNLNIHLWLYSNCVPLSIVIFYLVFTPSHTSLTNHNDRYWRKGLFSTPITLTFRNQMWPWPRYKYLTCPSSTHHVKIFQRCQMLFLFKWVSFFLSHKIAEDFSKLCGPHSKLFGLPRERRVIPLKFPSSSLWIKTETNLLRVDARIR